MLSQDFLSVMRRILTDRVAVEDATLGWRSQGNVHPQRLDHPPLGRFGFAKSPAGQRVALHSVAAGPRCYPEVICEQIKQGDETPRLPAQDHSQIQTPPCGSR